MFANRLILVHDNVINHNQAVQGKRNFSRKRNDLADSSSVGQLMEQTSKPMMQEVMTHDHLEQHKDMGSDLTTIENKKNHSCACNKKSLPQSQRQLKPKLLQTKTLTNVSNHCCSISYHLLEEIILTCRKW